MIIGKRLEIFRESIGIKTAKAFGEMIDMKPGSYQKYISDVSVPGGNILIKLAELGADINYILTGEGYVDKGIERVFEERFKKLESRITELESENYRYIKHIEKLEGEKEVLLSQVSTLNEIVSAKKIGKT